MKRGHESSEMEHAQLPIQTTGVPRNQYRLTLCVRACVIGRCPSQRLPPDAAHAAAARRATSTTGASGTAVVAAVAALRATATSATAIATSTTSMSCDPT